MATTPPAQIRAEARTPPTPLHGSAYHSNPSPSRYNTRSTRKPLPDSTNSSFTQSLESSRTPRSPRLDRQQELQSPQTTPKRKYSRRVQVISPTSPDSIEDVFAPTNPPNRNYLSATTMLSEGMLPTPVKTPQKKNIPKSAMAARALFQDPTNIAHSSPRKQQKRRHNGFSLERDRTPTEEIAIFTDSRDQVPQVDDSPSNPFYTPPKSTKKRPAPTSHEPVVTAGPSKRRKVTPKETKKLDPQVEEAIQKDEGMVYVFRGKKVYRRFEDAGDEEEIIDPDELGMLRREHGVQNIIKPLKTLTRKSIQPRRLFQTEKHQSSSDEEADTEIEDNGVVESNIEIEDEQSSPSRATRSHTTKMTKQTGGKKTSPFDAWRRLKSGAASTSAAGRKRNAAEALET